VDDVTSLKPVGDGALINDLEGSVRRHTNSPAGDHLRRGQFDSHVAADRAEVGEVPISEFIF
jgi:hypothetical protein